jgi:hypothetical protein
VASRQYELERRCSASVTAVLLGALDAVLAQWRRDPNERSAALLEETYLAMVVAAYSVPSMEPSVAAASTPSRHSGSTRPSDSIAREIGIAAPSITLPGVSVGPARRQVPG